MRLVTYLIEYLGEFEFIFETVLDYESRDQMGSFEAKIRSRKSHAWAPLNTILLVTPTNPRFRKVCARAPISRTLPT
jgi:hypothetical protein